MSSVLPVAEANKTSLPSLAYRDRGRLKTICKWPEAASESRSPSDGHSSFSACGFTAASRQLEAGDGLLRRRSSRPSLGALNRGRCPPFHGATVHGRPDSESATPPGEPETVRLGQSAAPRPAPSPGVAPVVRRSSDVTRWARARGTGSVPGRAARRPRGRRRRGESARHRVPAREEEPPALAPPPGRAMAAII